MCLSGGLQMFNNWSPWLVGSQTRSGSASNIFATTPTLLEAFRRRDGDVRDCEIAKIGIVKAEDVEDSHVVHVPKTYPAYFGSYDRFDVIRNYIDRFENLFLDRPQRHAQIQQSGPLDADGHDRRRKYRQRDHDEGQHLGDQH